MICLGPWRIIMEPQLLVLRPQVTHLALGSFVFVPGLAILALEPVQHVVGSSFYCYQVFVFVVNPAGSVLLLWQAQGLARPSK